MLQKINQQSNKKSLLSLIAVNVLVIFQALIFDWHLGTVIWIYYIQTVAIFGIALWSQKKKKAMKTNMIILLTYGFILSLVTIGNSTPDTQVLSGFSNIQWLGVLAAGLLFLSNHLYSYSLDNKQNLNIRDSKSVSLRLIGIHFSFFVVLTSMPLLLFMILKTVIDVWSHSLQHKNK